MLWSVVGLPVLLPIVALLQLLFPGILREQWRQYRYAVHVLMTQSTIICLHWALVRWVFTQRTWWLSDDALAVVLVLVAMWGTARAWSNRSSSNRNVASAPPAGEATAATQPDAQSPVQPTVQPTSLEFWAIGVTLFAGLAWAAWSIYSGGSIWDQMLVVTVAAAAGFAHLVYRALSARTAPRTALVSTEVVFVTMLMLAGAGVALYSRQTEANQLASAVEHDWPTFHVNAARTGSTDAADPGPSSPRVLWTFDPAERKGRVTIHSSPCVVDGLVYVGAMHEVLSLAQGYLYCVNAATGREANGAALPLGSRIWRYSAEDTFKPVFASPTVVAGQIFIGEGYHQDSGCRLVCLDARDANHVNWIKPTASHVESTCTARGSRVYFGAGDDGLRCLDTSDLQPSDAAPLPKTVWHLTGYHVDSSPTLLGERLFAGSVLGDSERELCALCVNAETGELLWKIPAPLPVPSAPAAIRDRVYFGLGNGKLNDDDPRPEGRIWCLDAADGHRLWEFRSAGSILASPAVADERVYCCSRDRHCYALDATSGEVLWKTNLEEPIVASPVVSGGRVFVLTLGGSTVALDGQSGAIVWRCDETRNDHDDAFSSPALVDGRLYVASGGKLYCLGDAQP